MAATLKRANTRLTTRLTQLSLAAAVGLGLLFSSFQIVHDFNQQQRLSDRELTELIRAFDKAASQAAYTLDRVLASEVVEGLLQQRYITQVSLFDDEGHPLASHGEAAVLPSPTWIYGFFERSPGRYQEHRFPLHHHSDLSFKVGHLQVEQDQLQVYADFMARSVWTLFSGLLRNLLLAGLLLWLYRYYLSRPVNHLLEELSQVHPERPSEQRIAEGLDEHYEFRELRHSINRLLENSYRTFKLERKATRQLQDERDLFVGGRVLVFKCQLKPGLPIEYASPNLERILGFSAELLQTQNSPLENLIHLDDRATHHKELEQALGAGSHSLEHRPYRLLRSDGREMWVYDFTNLIEPAQGNSPNQIHSYLVDITNQIEAQAALLESQSRLSQAQAIAQLGSWTWWPEENRLESSAELLRIFDRLPSNPLTQLEDLISGVFPADRALVESELRTAFERRAHFEMVHRIRSTNGEVRQVQHRGHTVTSPSGKVHLEGILQDITDIRKTETFLSSVLETTNEGYWEVDNEGVTRMVNPALCEILDQTESEILGRSVFDLIAPSEADQMVRQLKQRDAGEAGIYEITMLRGDGSHVYCLISATPIFDSAGQKLGSFALITDISELRNTHQELLKAKLEAEAANRAKTEFLANMSHEIRTPLNAVIGFADILQAELSDEEHKRYVAIVQTASNSLLNLINDLLDLSKIEAGMLEINLEPTDPQELIKDLESFFVEKLKSKDLAFSAEAAADLPKRLYVDELRLRQVLLNLVGNAVKFTESGSISVNLSCAQVLDEHLEFILEVQDTGIGIPLEDQSLIFDSFRQRDGQSTRKYGGTGLGLAVSRRFVELMGGRIELESEVDEGSLFRVLLPKVRYQAEVSHSRPKRSGSEVRFKDLKVLVVDDVETNRSLTRAILGTAGIECFEAESGPTAVERSKNQAPDLILMDIRMPEMNGYEATRIIRSLPGGDQFLILALTASVSALAEPIDGERLFDGIIHKPVRPNELLRALGRFFPGQVEG
ncbi:MAG: PAS domain S-box protein [bacterium]|nr:PAS domain S-box protein [bacterium]